MIEFVEEDLQIGGRCMNVGHSPCISEPYGA